MTLAKAVEQCEALLTHPQHPTTAAMPATAGSGNIRQGGHWA